MSATKDKKTGKWIANYYEKDAEGKLKRRMKRGFASKVAAQQYEIDHKGTICNDAGGMTFEQMFESMSLRNRANDLTTATRRQRLQDYASDLWTRQIHLLTKDALLAWQEGLKEEDAIGTVTKNEIIGYVKSVFVYADEVYDVYNSGKILQKFPKELEDYHDYIIITYDQFQQLLAVDSNQEIKDIFTAMFMLGCRKGEARALFKTDFNPATKMIHISKSIRRYADSLKTPKNPYSIRYVPVDDQTAEMFTRLQSRQGKWMFGDYTPISLTSMQDHFKADLKAAGLPKEMRLHDLRHSHVSLLWAAGVPIPEISKRIGHSSPAQTMRTYSHIFDNSQSASINVLNALNSKK